MGSWNIGPDIIRAFQAGAQERMQAEQQAREKEAHDLAINQKKLELQALKHDAAVKDWMLRNTAGQAQFDQQQGSRATEIPISPFNVGGIPLQQEPMQGATVTEPNTQALPLPPINIPGGTIPGSYGNPDFQLPDRSITPASDQELLKQHLNQVALEAQVKNAAEPVYNINGLQVPKALAAAMIAAASREKAAADTRAASETTAAANRDFQATQKEQDRLLSEKLTTLRLAATAAQGELNRKQQADLAAGKVQNAKPTQAELTNFNYYARLNDSIKKANDLEPVVGKWGLAGQIRFKSAPNFLQSEEGQLLNQAAQQFTEARLRKESGAAVPQSEYENDMKVYFPQPGDSEKTLRNKRISRNVLHATFILQSGNAYRDSFGDAVTVRDPKTGITGTIPMSQVMRAINSGAEIVP